MNDVKTVKVDNWGSFFLQKLQNFFNKTDYCDLTLQFRDNSQLKVHRLVLSACTDYFNILETTTECMDDVLLMPRDLQADVVVPIVNFMYTGTLEFEFRMYERLLKTARDMKMSVLLKLLEAHKRAMPQKPEPIILNKAATSHRPAMRGGGFVSTRGGRGGGYSYGGGRLSDGSDNANASSDFERLRRTGIENPTGKRPLSLSNSSPPTKKLNLQDVKEYTEATRLRKQLNEGEDDVGQDYDPDDTYSNSSTEEVQPRQSMSLLARNNRPAPAPPKAELTTATVTLQELPGQKMDHAKIIAEVMKKYPHLLKNNKNIKLKITQKVPGAQGTSFTVRAESTPVAAVPAASPAVKKAVAQPSTPLAQQLLASKIKSPSGAEPARLQTPPKAAPATPLTKGSRIDSKTMHKLIAMGAENTEGPWLCLRCGVDGKPIGIPSYRAFRKHLINIHREKIDARLCEHCGLRSKNRNELYYHIQTQHNIPPPQGFNFPECKTCHFVALDATALDVHQLDEGHGTYTPTMTRSKATKAVSEVKESEPEFACDHCEKAFMTRKALTMHCNVKHRMKRGSGGGTRHDDTEDENDEDESEEDPDVDFDSALRDDVDYVPRKSVTTAYGRKAKAVSNVVAPKGKTRSSEAESLSTVATGIATSLGLGEAETSASGMEYTEGGEEIVDESHLIEEALASVHGEQKQQDEVGAEEEEEVETKFLAEDGSELQLTAAQKAELMSQLDTAEGKSGGVGAGGEEVVMMYEDTAEEEVTAKDAPEVLKDGDEVLMVYGGPRSAVAKDKEEEKEVAMEEEAPSIEEQKVEKEKNKLIKELEGDWDDEVEEKPEAAEHKEEAEEPASATAEEAMEDSAKTENVSVGTTKEAELARENEKKAPPEATLAEFMNDWEDEEN